jgi:hypothetical protein
LYKAHISNNLNTDIQHLVTSIQNNNTLYNEILKTEKGAKDFPYHNDKYSYLDSYFGGLHFGGQEVVWEYGTAIWGMNYFGQTFEYCCAWSGDLKRFSGEEKIIYNDKIIYNLSFHGGAIKYR